jgi:hypothetical protein
MAHKTRHDELKLQVTTFHKEHPKVWELFCRFTHELIGRGFQHYSAKGVFERIRWETAEAKTGETSFKLNNNYSAFYARRFMATYPDRDGFFRTREQISKGSSATHLPPLTPQDYPDEGGNNARIQ